MVMTIVRVTLVFAGTAAYLGLAILGWGGWSAFFAHPARVALAVVLAVLAAVSSFADGNLSPGVREDRGNRWIIGALVLLGLLAAYLAPYTDRKAFWTIDGDRMRWLGVVLFAAGGALRIWPVFVLGHRFSGLVTIQPGHTLVTTGVYGIIRHPSYDGAHDPATPGVHPCRRAAPTLAVWRGVRRLLRPDITADSWALLARRAHALAHPQPQLQP